MIPYFEVQTIPILGSDSFAFFFLAALAVGFAVFLKNGLKRRFTANQICEFYSFTVIPACFGAHVFNLLAYYPDQFLEDPFRLLNVSGGMASLGGILSFFIFMFAYLWYEGALSRWRSWLDASIQAFVPALLVGRIGCTLIHDHKGAKSDFFLAIQFPGGPRHDAGFYEFLFLLFVMLPAMSLFARRERAPGVFFALFAFLYAPFRFLCEYVRLHETRYWTLTPAQYGCVAVLLIGIYLAATRERGRKRTAFPPEAGGIEKSAGLIERGTAL